MANLGNLWFEVGVKDKTSEDLEKMKKNIEAKLRSVDVKINVNFKDFANQMKSVLDNSSFKAKVSFEDEAAINSLKRQLEGAKMGLYTVVDKERLNRSVTSALKGEKFKIDVAIDKATATKAVRQALLTAGLSSNTNVTASDVRAKKIEEIQNRITAANERNRIAIERQNLALQRQQATYARTRSASNSYGSSVKAVNEQIIKQYKLTDELGQQISNIFSIYAMERFLKTIVEIGGQFQQQRLALRTMFGDVTKADVLFGQIKNLAVISPFEFKELASYTKQLAAFSIPYNEMYDTTKRLADISSGVGVDMGRLILAYGQVRTAAYLRGQEVRQFTEAGIPLLDRLAEKYTMLEGRLVSVGDVFDRISKRQVSFQAVKDVLWEMTNQGGMFYNMQANLADTLAGKLANLRDAYDIMLADMAESNNSMLSSGLDALTDMMGHWQSYSKYIMAATTAVVSYQIAMVALTAAHAAWNKVVYANKVLSFISALNGATKAANAFGVALNFIKANPLMLIAGAVAAVVGSLTLFSSSTEKTDDAIRKMNEGLGDLKAGLEGIKENDALIDQYEALSNKQNRSAEETKRLDNMTRQLQETFNGAETAVDEYGVAISMSVEKMRELNKEQKTAIYDTYRIKLEESKKSLEELQAKISKQQGIMESLSERGKNATTDLARENVESSTAREADALRKLRLEEIKLQEAVRNAKKEMDSFEEAEESQYRVLNEWQKAAEKARATVSAVPEVKPETGLTDYLDSLKKAIDKIEEENATIQSGNKYTSDQYQQNIKDLQKMKALYASLGGAATTKGEKGEDPIAKQLENEIDLIKQAKQEYDKLLASVGKAGATKRVNDNPQFAGLGFDPDSYVGMLQKMQGKIAASGAQQKNRQKLNNTVSQLITGVTVEEAKQAIKETVDAMKKEIEKQTAKWSLYKSLFDITGDKRTSMSLAFGEDLTGMEGIDSETDALKARLKEKFGKTYEELKEISETGLKEMYGAEADVATEMLKRIEDETRTHNEEILKNALTLAAEYADATEKIKKLENLRDNEVSKLQKSSGFSLLSKDMQDEAVSAIFKKYAKQIQDLRDESIKLSPVWQKLFGETANMGYVTLKKTVEEARKMAGSATESKNGKTGETEYTLQWTDKDGQVEKTNISLNEYLQLIKKIAETEKNLANDNPFAAIADDLKKLKSAGKDAEGVHDAISQLGEHAAKAAEEIAGVADAWGGMFDSLGNEGAADALSFTGDILGEFGNLAKGLASGNMIQMAASVLTFIPNMISKISKFHDKKLDRAIQKSQLEVTKLQNAYSNLETEIERQLGSLTRKQYTQQYSNLIKQREEIDTQLNAEDAKKKTDYSKIEDYKQQIKELDDQIRYFAEDMADELYGINLKDWASQFSDSIVDAWRSGEDAVTAFGDTASDILADVANEALKMAIIEPMLEELRKKIPDMMADGSLDSSEIGQIAQSLLGIQEGYNSALEYLDQINSEVLRQTNGEIDLKNAGSSSSAGSSSASGGIEASEETMQLTNSYLNAIRQDVSVLRNIIEKAAGGRDQTTSIIAQAQLQQLNAIAENTLANANAAKAIQESLQSVMTVGSGGKAIRIK